MRPIEWNQGYIFWFADAFGLEHQWLACNRFNMSRNTIDVTNQYRHIRVGNFIEIALIGGIRTGHSLSA